MTADVVERSVTVERDGRVVPAYVWEPAGRAGGPVVLLGHGGSGSKRAARIERLAHWFAGEAGLAAAAVDGPYHGDRVPGPVPAVEYQRRMVREGVPTVVRDMVDDWLLLLASLSREGVVDDKRVGYVGLSLGTRFGIPLAAALGARLRCAVFGKFGVRQAEQMDPGLHTPDLFLDTARRITAPVLVHVQWDDERFPRAGQLELFDAVASTEKILIGRPGAHGGSHRDDEPTWRAFVARHLLPG